MSSLLDGSFMVNPLDAKIVRGTYVSVTVRRGRTDRRATPRTFFYRSNDTINRVGQLNFNFNAQPT